MSVISRAGVGGKTVLTSLESECAGQVRHEIRGKAAANDEVTQRPGIRVVLQAVESGPRNGAFVDIQLLEITASRQGWQDTGLQVLQAMGNSKAPDLDIQLAYQLAVLYCRSVLTNEVDMAQHHPTE